MSTGSGGRHRRRRRGRRARRSHVARCLSCGGDQRCRVVRELRPSEQVPDGVDPETAVREPVTRRCSPGNARFEVQVGSTFAGRVGNTVTHLLDREDVATVAAVEPTAALLNRQLIDSAAMKLRSSGVVLGPAAGGRVYYAGFGEPIDFEDSYATPTSRLSANVLEMPASTWTVSRRQPSSRREQISKPSCRCSGPGTGLVGSCRYGRQRSSMTSEYVSLTMRVRRLWSERPTGLRRPTEYQDRGGMAEWTIAPALKAGGLWPPGFKSQSHRLLHEQAVSGKYASWDLSRRVEARATRDRNEWLGSNPSPTALLQANTRGA